MVNIIRTGQQWHQDAHELLTMKYQAIEEWGRPMGKMDGNLDLPWNVIDDTQCTSTKLEVNAELRFFHRGGNAISVNKRLDHRGRQAINT
jgi:hypothetical protein